MQSPNESAGPTPSSGQTSDNHNKPDGSSGHEADLCESAAPENLQSVANNAQAVKNADAAEIARFVSTIKDIDQQVGEHVIGALRHADTVAVLTSVVVGPGGQQHIVSAALNPSRMAQINELLACAAIEREEETPCVGFHCLIKSKKAAPSPDLDSDR
ncbi:MAG: hypothetical protein KDB22_05135 [Planctomycetales bacterium]|nr:hypothetical protein [Planctomycetales bacterium]